MADNLDLVVPAKAAPTPLQFHEALVAGLARVADTAALQAEHTEAMRDGVRDHRETIRIAEKARPVVASLNNIIAEADRTRGAR